MSPARSLPVVALAALPLAAPVAVLSTDRGPAPASAVAAVEDRGPGAAGDAAPGPVLLELFTSQGCSSCPPAESLFREIVTARALPAVDVVGIAWHVDYWNRLGWEDPFSSPRWSRLQQWYGERLRGGRLYTPQAVVQGSWHDVGSDRRAVLGALRAAGAAAAGLGFRPAAGGARVTVEWAAPHGRPLDLAVARIRSGLVTDVGAGELRGRRLHQERVGRDLEIVPVPAGVRRIDLAADVAAGPAAEPGDRRIAWLRDPASGRVLAVGRWPAAGSG